MSKITAAQQEKWTTLLSKPYSQQAIWFMNGFWEELQEKEAENIWGFEAGMAKFDEAKKHDGTELDEFWSHKFLESLGETLTVVALREKMKSIDLDFNKKMSMIEYLIFRYKKTVQAVLDAPQGENKEEVAEAQAKVEEAQRAVEEMVQRLEEQKAALSKAVEAAEAAAAAEAEATQKANEAKAKADEAKAAAAAAESAAKASADAAQAAETAAAPYRQAVAENEAALAEIKRQEDEISSKKAALEAVINGTGGVVSKNKASNELSQLLAEDPLPLRKARISQQATLKKMEKAAAPFQAAAEKAKVAADESSARAAEAKSAADASENAAQQAAEAAEHARNERAAAEKAAGAAEEAARQVEVAAAEAEKQMHEAEDFLEAVKQKGGVAHGAVWWMERSLKEKQKYMPQSKRKL